jgi:hypothetical protein
VIFRNVCDVRVCDISESMWYYLLNNKYFCCISLNIACKFECYRSKSKLVLSGWNGLYLIAIDFIAFTLHEIKHSVTVPSPPPPAYSNMKRKNWKLWPRLVKDATVKIKRYDGVSQC